MISSDSSVKKRPNIIQCQYWEELRSPYERAKLQPNTGYNSCTLRSNFIIKLSIVWRKAPVAFPDSSSVMDKFLSAMEDGQWPMACLHISASCKNFLQFSSHDGPLCASTPLALNLKLLHQKKRGVHKIGARNSGAGNGCANFMGAWHFSVLSAGKPPMPIKILLLGGGVGVS